MKTVLLLMLHQGGSIHQWVPAFNRRFKVCAAESGSVFVPLLGVSLDDILCIKAERTVRGDNCESYQGKVLQIPKTQGRSREELWQQLDGFKVLKLHEGFHLMLFRTLTAPASDSLHLGQAPWWPGDPFCV